MCRNEIVRQVVKTSSVAGVVPTVPSTDNHQDGTWLATDIYKGELFFNKADGILYTRSDTGIEVLTPEAVSGLGVARVYDVIISQTGTNAPEVVYEISDTIGGTHTFSRSTNGEFRINNTGNYPVGRTSVKFGNEINDGVTNFANISVLSTGNTDDNIYFNTVGDTGSAVDSVLLYTRMTITVFPLIPVS